MKYKGLIYLIGEHFNEQNFRNLLNEELGKVDYVIAEYEDFITEDKKLFKINFDVKFIGESNVRSLQESGFPESTMVLSCSSKFNDINKPPYCKFKRFDNR
ncbi:hypothetical protein P5E77_07060 [Clostridium perfringens]|nr:hypothetical protein [Clostridium perfringens]